MSFQAERGTLTGFHRKQTAPTSEGDEDSEAEAVTQLRELARRDAFAKRRSLKQF